jgi:hypothetical protein
MSLSERVQRLADDRNTLADLVGSLRQTGRENFETINKLHTENSALHQQMEKLRDTAWLRVMETAEYREEVGFYRDQVVAQQIILNAVRNIDSPTYADYGGHFIAAFSMWSRFQDTLDHEHDLTAEKADTFTHGETAGDPISEHVCHLTPNGGHVCSACDREEHSGWVKIAEVTRAEEPEREINYTFFLATPNLLVI